MRSPAAPPVAFVKMHGLGNDFVIIDARGIAPDLGAAAARAIADRHRGVGCDQVLILEKPRAAEAAAFMRIFNADGSEAEACGDVARCVADRLMRAENRSEIAIETAAGTLAASRAGTGRLPMPSPPAWVIRMRRFSLPTPRRSISRGWARCWSATRSFPRAPISASRKCLGRSVCACACGSAATG